MNVGIEQLAVWPGVTGICLHHGADVRYSRLPGDITSARAGALCGAVTDFFRTYRRAGRDLKQAWFGFDGTSVLSVTPPAHEDGTPPPEVYLTFFLSAAEEAGSLIRGTRAFLAAYAALLLRPPSHPGAPPAFHTGLPEWKIGRKEAA